MSIAQADVDKAITALWDSSSVGSKFSDLWDSGVTASEFLTLHNIQAHPKQPFPYCVFQTSVAAREARMSGGNNSLQEVRDTPLEFRIHARAIDGDSRTAKEIAAYLAEEVMKVFGGHPTSSPSEMSLDNGNLLQCLYDNDVGMRTGDNEYQWSVSYFVKVDVPVMV